MPAGTDIRPAVDRAGSWAPNIFMVMFHVEHSPLLDSADRNTLDVAAIEFLLHARHGVPGIALLPTLVPNL
jgi:hypothetical protein